MNNAAQLTFKFAPFFFSRFASCSFLPVVLYVFILVNSKKVIVLLIYTFQFPTGIWLLKGL